MAYPPAAYRTWTAGEVLTASDLNNTVTTIDTNYTPDSINDYSPNTTTMRVTTDPYPAAAESLATTLAGELERIRYVIKQITGKSQWYVDAAAIGSKGADVVSANALTLGTDGSHFVITGTTAITSIGTLGVGSVVALKFAAALTLTHHSTNLILPAATNITTAAGDIGIFLEYGAGTWICMAYTGGVYSFITTGTQTISGAKTFGSVVTLPNGAVGAPSFNLGDATTGMYRTAANQLGFALNGVKALTLESTGVADDTTYVLQRHNAGAGSGNSAELITQSTASITTAKAILTLDYNGGIMLVAGSDGSGNEFNDAVIVSFFSGTPIVLGSQTSRGSPAVRTYSLTGSGVVKLAMASGTYTARAIAWCVGTR